MTRVQCTVNGLALLAIAVGLAVYDARTLADADADRRGEDARLNGSPRLKPGDFNLKLHPRPRREAPDV